MDDTDRNLEDYDGEAYDDELEEDAELFEDELEGLDNPEDEPGSEYLLTVTGDSASYTR